MAYSSCHFSSAFSYNLFSTTTSFANMWVVDSGATNHMCGSSSPLHNISNLSQPITMGFAEARSTSVHQMGSFRLNNVITLNNVLRIPTFTINLHFVSQLTTETRCTFLFLSNSSVQDDQGALIGMGSRDDGLYILMADGIPTSSKHTSKTLVSIRQDVWHASLGHLCDSRFHFFFITLILLFHYI